MPSIIRVESKKDLEASLELPNVKPSKVIYANISDIISSDIIPEKYHLFKYKILMPPPNLFNIHLTEGFSHRYVDGYLRYLRIPEVLFYINEMVYCMLFYEKNLILFCSSDEKEFRYLKILGAFINETYRIPMISYKKFVKGKESAIVEDIADIMYFCDMQRAEIIKLLDKLDIKLPKKLNQRIPRKLLK